MSKALQKNYESSFYTAQEVIQILEKAKELQVASIKLEGFEAAFLPSSDKLPPSKAPQKDSQSYQRNESDRKCRHCGSFMTFGNYGKYYCHPCYLARKESKWQQTKQW